jgi:hypothetical protein
MRAVWSFWPAPYRACSGRTWREPRHHLLAWGLSLGLAREHFDETVLVTDREGKALLVDRLGLQFDHVVTELERLRGVDEGWWTLGKLAAYSVQDRPFVHLDTDVFLWRPLPAGLQTAAVVAQCPEWHKYGSGSSEPGFGLHCDPRAVAARFERHGLEVPVEWQWAVSRFGHDSDRYREESCGILGGNRVDFLRYFANAALAMVMDPAHAAVWGEIPHKDGYNMLVEQFFLAACVDYHRYAPESAFRGVTTRYVFESVDEAMRPEAAARAGFSHLWSDVKAHPEVAGRLEQRMAAMDAGFAKHCARVAEAWT